MNFKNVKPIKKFEKQMFSFLNACIWYDFCLPSCYHYKHWTKSSNTTLLCFSSSNHLSLYKQGPEWPRVKLSLIQFPPKNVTSCYSANKNDAFHFQCVFICHLFLRFLFLMLRIPMLYEYQDICFSWRVFFCYTLIFLFPLHIPFPVPA